MSEVTPESRDANLDLTQGAKNDAGKSRYDLVSPVLVHATAEVLTFGAEKYAPYNWAKGILFSRVYGALQRHLTAWQAGEENDDETGMPHLWHASCCLMFLIHYTFPAFEEQYNPYDDRPDYENAAQSPA
jgi:hypothetical protein